MEEERARQAAAAQAAAAATGGGEGSEPTPAAGPAEAIDAMDEDTLLQQVGMRIYLRILMCGSSCRPQCPAD